MAGVGPGVRIIVPGLSLSLTQPPTQMTAADITGSLSLLMITCVPMSPPGMVTVTLAISPRSVSPPVPPVTSVASVPPAVLGLNLLEDEA